MKMFKTLIPAVAAMAMSTHAVAEDRTIVDIAAGDDRFETLVTAVQAAGLAETLSGEGPFTVFAPTDDAFDALPEGVLDSLLADPEALANVLLYHTIVGAEVPAEVAVTLSDATMANEQSIALEVRDGSLFVNDSRVIITDVFASNGVIHVIDKVLIPEAVDTLPNIIETAQEAGVFNTLLTAVEVAGLTEALSGEGPFTVFAPTDEAFAKIPAEDLEALLADIPALQNVLLFHVTAGALFADDVLRSPSLTMLNGDHARISFCSEARIENAVILSTDIETSNGVIHVISDVIIP